MPPARPATAALLVALLSGSCSAGTATSVACAIAVQPTPAIRRSNH